MKRKKWMQTLNGVEDAYLREADPGKASAHRRRWPGVMAACLAVVLAGSALLAVFANRGGSPDIVRYQDSAYYPVIRTIDALTPKASEEDLFSKLFPNKDMAADGSAAPGDNNGADMAPSEENAYREVTDNQVAGVIEGDRFKRSDTHIFYLDRSDLRIYTIAGGDSRECAIYPITVGGSEEEEKSYNWHGYAEEWEIYLSQDARTLTVLSPYYSAKQKTARVQLLTLDVSDPTMIREKGRVQLSGGYLSSRLTDEGLLVFTKYRPSTAGMDFDKPETFLPCVESNGQLTPVAPDSIALPEDATDVAYTVINRFDTDGTKAVDTFALFSFSETVYVSDSTVYATRRHSVDGVAGTEIRGVSYAGGSLTAVGSTTVPGSVKDQYSLDEYAGLLRVVTTVRKAATKRVNGEGISDEIVSAETGGSSASLWLVNLTDWSLRAKVEEFAPIGETVQSVRFDRQYAYVCTAVTHQYLDPVFSFDLTDPDNIISRDSGTINGYSTSLIQLGGGYLLGIGYGDSRNDMKVEVWQVTDGAVTSVCSYLAQNTRFSEVYKSYYIDRENGLFGFVTYGGTVDYRLLRFDGYDLVTVARVDLYPSFDGSGANFGDCRATIVDGWLYTLIPGDFRVTEIGI